MNEPSDQNLIEAIRSVPVSSSRPKLKTLRNLFPEIENALNSGKSIDDILSSLSTKNFNIGRAHFQSALSKIRRERGLIGKKNKKVPVPPSLPVAAALETNTLENGSDQTVEAVMPAPMPAPKLRCLPIELGIHEFTRNKGISLDMYEPGDLEHTAVPGVMLSLEQRLTSATLEFINDATGEIRKEDRMEKRFRTLWRVPIPATIFKSSVDFVVMNESLFKHRTAEREAEAKKKSQL